MTPTRLIEVWIGLVIPTLVTAVALGMTAGTGALLLALSCAAAGIVLLLWPAEQSLTAADVLYDRDRSA